MEKTDDKGHRKKISDYGNCFKESAQDYEIENGREGGESDRIIRRVF